jgi:hypothetical protein
MILPAASDRSFQFEAAPLTAIGYLWVNTFHWWPNQNVTKVAFACALCDITRGGPAIAPSGQSNDQGLERESSFGRPILVHVFTIVGGFL